MVSIEKGVYVVWGYTWVMNSIWHELGIFGSWKHFVVKLFMNEKAIKFPVQKTCVSFPLNHTNITSLAIFQNDSTYLAFRALYGHRHLS